MRARRTQSRVDDSLKVTEEKVTTKDNSPKVDKKVVANYKQTASKSNSKPVANHKQTVSKVVAKKEPPKRPKKQTSSKVVAQLVAGVVADYKQTSSKVVAKASFKQLTGVQKSITKIIYNSCRSNGNKVTSPMAISYLAEMAQASIGTTKNAIIRLCEKGIIGKENFKNGRGGWTEYRLNDHTYTEMLHSESDSKVVANKQQNGSKVVAQPVAELVASLSSSNSNIINTNTTENKNLDEIQIPQLLKQKGFGLSHLKQMIQKFDFEIGEIQQFLEAYAFDLQGEQGKKLEARGMNLIGYFFGALKNGGYNPVSKDFKTAEDQAMEDQLHSLEERKRVREERVQRIFELKFEEWLDEQGREQLLKLVPSVGEYMGVIHRGDLLNYFQENVHAQSSN